MRLSDLEIGETFILVGSTFCGVVLNHSVGGTVVRYVKRVEGRPDEQQEEIPTYSWQISNGTEVKRRSEAQMKRDKVRSQRVLAEWKEEQND